MWYKCTESIFVTWSSNVVNHLGGLPSIHSLCFDVVHEDPRCFRTAHKRLYQNHEARNGKCTFRIFLLYFFIPWFRLRINGKIVTSNGFESTCKIVTSIILQSWRWKVDFFCSCFLLCFCYYLNVILSREFIILFFIRVNVFLDDRLDRLQIQGGILSYCTTWRCSVYNQSWNTCFSTQGKKFDFRKFFIC